MVFHLLMVPIPVLVSRLLNIYTVFLFANVLMFSMETYLFIKLHLKSYMF